ncbi:MAG: GNAT family N-acetyltransferase [Planctomycetes bacterium]|nr:GNAT family N-acetyltransferase [Planctomycetota bacterium]
MSAAVSHARPRWILRAFAELTTEELYEILAARAEVFVVEQSCAYLDIDQLDRAALHLWAPPPNEDQRVGAYLRILPPGARYAEEVAIGRVLTRGSQRGVGWGRALIAEGVRIACARWPEHDLKLGAQTHLTHLYAEFGFAVCGPGFLEDGIPHTEMRRPR